MEELKLTFAEYETEFELIEGSGGTFLINCNGETLFDKKDVENRWPAYREIPTLVQQKILKLP